MSSVFSMRSDGWCPSELSMMFTRLNCAGLYFMSHVERPNPARKHPMIRVHPAAASAIKTEENSFSQATFVQSSNVLHISFMRKHIGRNTLKDVPAATI